MDTPDQPTGAAIDDGAGTGAVIDAQQILRDRPDVFAAYYRDYFGPNNDRNSPAWAHRVGGTTAEDYALYWLRSHGLYEGYAQRASSALGAPAEWAGYEGRSTIDGIPLAKILSDRPDVFQAFFTEYYGPNNDRNSDAWVKRVGGATVEDYANYWYNAHGRLEGYQPTITNQPEPVGSPALEESVDATPAPEPPTSVDPSLDPWNHPAIYPDWLPPYAGWRPPSAGSESEAEMGGEGDETPESPEPDVAQPGLDEATRQVPGEAAMQADPDSTTGAAAKEPFAWSDHGSPMLWPGPPSLFEPDPFG